MTEPGQIVILNGAPRSGKSSIAAAIQESFDGIWLNLGVDSFGGSITPKRLLPGIGLRPGGGRPDIEAALSALYAVLYEAIAAASRLGLNVVVDVGHHDGYSRPLDILGDCARRLAGLPVLFVGVRCPIDVILQRRNQDQAGREGQYVKSSPGDPVPEPVRLWQESVHADHVYDLEVDTSRLTPAQCADAIRGRLDEVNKKPSAFERLAPLQR